MTHQNRKCAPGCSDSLDVPVFCAYLNHLVGPSVPSERGLCGIHLIFPGLILSLENNKHAKETKTKHLPPTESLHVTTTPSYTSCGRTPSSSCTYCAQRHTVGLHCPCTGSVSSWVKTVSLESVEACLQPGPATDCSVSSPQTTRGCRRQMAWLPPGTKKMGISLIRPRCLLWILQSMR